MKKLLLTLAAILTFVSAAVAQVTTVPAVVQEDTQDLWVYFHADEGNAGLKGLPQTAKVYAHTGVLTSSSTGDSDWKYAPAWLDNDPKYMLEYVEPDLWKLYIGDIRTYYGITSLTEKITKLAFVFRDDGGNRQGKTASGGDIFVDVLASGLQIAMNMGIDGDVVTEANPTLNIVIGTTQKADITLSIDRVEIASVKNSDELKCTYTLPEAGKSYMISVKAQNDNEVKTLDKMVYYTRSSPKAPYPGGKVKYGPVRNSDGSVTFCLAAPGKSGVNIVGAWDNYEPGESNLMNCGEDENGKYFWLTVKGLEDGVAYPYYFYIDGRTRVGDPYAHLVLDPYNDRYISKDVYPDMPKYPTEYVRNVCLGVYKSDINDYDWQVKDFEPAAHDNLIIYEMLFRDFTGTEGKANGNGTVRQAIEKIPYLKSLGVNAVELLPINEFDGNISWGYNPNFYFAPDKAYGTPDDYREFIDKCHAEGIAVILDMVFNQSSGLHPWYQMYEINSNPFYNRTAPHAYSVLNDWNQGNPLVRRQWEDCVQYWIKEYKIDGYRFDLVKGLGDNDSYANSGDSGTNAYNYSRVVNMRRIQNAMNAVKPNAIFINENLAGAQEENQMAETGQLNWANINNEGGQYAMGYKNNSSLKRFYAESDSRTWGSTVSYLESHDEERLAYKQIKYGASEIKDNENARMQRLGAAAAQMILTPGAHMIWQFSEMGNAQSTKDANGGNNTSPKIVDWNLLDNPAHKGLFENYAALTTCRTQNPDLFAKDAEFKSQVSALNWTNGRTIFNTKGNKGVYTFINPNLSGEITFDYTFPLKSEDAYYVLTKSHGADFKWDFAAGKVTVPANCFISFCTKNLSSVEEVEADFDPAAPAEYYDISGLRVENPTKGLYIVRQGSKTYKVVL